MGPVVQGGGGEGWEMCVVDEGVGLCVDESGKLTGGLVGRAGAPS